MSCQMIKMRISTSLKGLRPPLHRKPGEFDEAGVPNAIFSFLQDGPLLSLGAVGIVCRPSLFDSEDRRNENRPLLENTGGPTMRIK